MNAEKIMKFIDLMVGGGLVVTGVILLSHFRKRAEMPRSYRVLAIMLMILGFMVASWDVIFRSLGIGS